MYFNENNATLKKKKEQILHERTIIFVSHLKIQDAGKKCSGIKSYRNQKKINLTIISI